MMHSLATSKRILIKTLRLKVKHSREHLELKLLRWV
jgi:hypothetical protein